MHYKDGTPAQVGDVHVEYGTCAQFLKVACILLACMLTLALAGCASTATTAPATQASGMQAVANDVLLIADTTAASAATAMAMQKVPAADRQAVGSAVNTLATSLVSSVNSGAPVDTSSLKAMVAAKVARDKSLAPYAAPINATAGVILDGIAAQAATTPNASSKPYVLAALQAVQASTDQYATK